MPFKKRTPEEIIGKLREAEIILAQGSSTADACPQIGVSEQIYYRWRKEYGGLKTDQARRVKDLEKEYARLRRKISDLTLTALLRSAGWHVNRKRVERIWPSEGLKVPQKQPKRGRLPA